MLVLGEMRREVKMVYKKKKKIRLRKNGKKKDA